MAVSRILYNIQCHVKVWLSSHFNNERQKMFHLISLLLLIFQAEFIIIIIINIKKIKILIRNINIKIVKMISNSGIIGYYFLI